MTSGSTVCDFPCFDGQKTHMSCSQLNSATPRLSWRDLRTSQTPAPTVPHPSHDYNVWQCPRYLARLPPHSLAQAAGTNTTLGSRWTLLKNVGWQTCQRSNARFSSCRLGPCILHKYQATLPSVRGRPVVMQTSGAATEKLRSEEALYIAPNSNTTPLGLHRDPRPEPEKYPAPRVFSDWDKEECCPDLANSQHREDMSNAPSSLILGSVASAVFGGRWACAHLAANARWKNQGSSM